MVLSDAVMKMMSWFSNCGDEGTILFYILMQEMGQSACIDDCFTGCKVKVVFANKGVVWRTDVGVSGFSCIEMYGKDKMPCVSLFVLTLRSCGYDMFRFLVNCM